MTKTLLYIRVFILLPLMFSALVSCAVQQTSMRATNVGFTSEIDEPSSRGSLKRISSELTYVNERFCVSNDGSHIVFSGEQSGGGDRLLQLWKIPITGGAPVKITSGGSSDFNSPSFTLDGKFIVYESEGKIWKVRSDGAGGKLRNPGSGAGYDFGPNVSRNNMVAFCSTMETGMNETGTNMPNKYLIWTSNINGGELTQIREGLYPMWSPDGKKLVFYHQNDIWLINANGTDLMQLTNTPKIFESLPSFSPDGEQIVYVSNEDKDGRPMMYDYNIWTMRADGSQNTQITELTSWDSWPIWAEDGLYFLSARAAKSKHSQLQRI